MIPEGFHFLRPYWLLALLPVALLLWAGTRAAAQGSAWRRVVDAHLLRHLLVTSDGAPRRWPAAAAAAGLVAACVALAGPTWERIPQPTFAALDPTVVVLDMSPAMEARDVTPSRLARARHELQDVLARSRGGQVGLVLYADEPFVAVPLTDDARVIAELIPSLERGLMPPRAARTDRAIAQAAALLEQAGVPSGRIVLLTADAGALPDAARAAASSAAARGHTVSVLGVGADEAPARGVPALDRTGLEALAAAGGGRFAEIRADDADVAALLPPRAAPGARAAQSGSSAQADAWRDAGVWLVLVPLLLAPLAFRRGLVVALALAVLAAGATPSEAGVWDDLWSRRDQQAQAALQEGDAAAAAELFEDPAWQAAARYESGAFAESVAAYRALPGDDNRYNLGNALARAGQLEDALAAYDEVLARAPQHEDARFNRDLVQRLLDQQRQHQQQQQGQSGQQEEPQAGAQEEQQQGDGTDEEQQPGDGADEEQQQGDGADDAQHESAGEDAASREEQSARASDAQQEEHAQQPAAQPQPGREPPAEGGEAQASGSPQDEAPPQDEQRQAGAAQPEQGSGDPEPESDRAADARVDPAAQDDRTLAERLTQALGGDAEQKEHADTANEPQDAGETADEAHEAAASATEPPQPLDERAQAREQMLRSIPDDPGGLLRAKIRRRYAEQRYARDENTPYAQEETTPW